MRKRAIAGAILAGLILGALSVRLTVFSTAWSGGFEKDGWTGNVNIGSAAADPYLRAIIARVGLLALNKSETVYFNRTTDEKGQPLREDCDYQLNGGALPARWWSITIYADDEYLPVNGQDAASVDVTRIAKDDSGKWQVRVSAERKEAVNWLSSKNARAPRLSIRLYNPEPAARDDFASIPFPAITTLSCAGGRP